MEISTGTDLNWAPKYLFCLKLGRMYLPMVKISQLKSSYYQYFTVSKYIFHIFVLVFILPLIMLILVTISMDPQVIQNNYYISNAVLTKYSFQHRHSIFLKLRKLICPLRLCSFQHCCEYISKHNVYLTDRYTFQLCVLMRREHTIIYCSYTNRYYLLTHNLCT